MTPDGKRYYGIIRDKTLAWCGFDKEGAPVDEGQMPTNEANHHGPMVLSPDGRHLYITNSLTQHLDACRCDDKTGRPQVQWSRRRDRLRQRWPPSRNPFLPGMKSAVGWVPFSRKNWRPVCMTDNRNHLAFTCLLAFITAPQHIIALLATEDLPTDMCVFARVRRPLPIAKSLSFREYCVMTIGRDRHLLS
jgi:hypothetical protein